MSFIFSLKKVCLLSFLTIPSYALNASVEEPVTTAQASALSILAIPPIMMPTSPVIRVAVPEKKLAADTQPETSQAVNTPLAKPLPRALQTSAVVTEQQAEQKTENITESPITPALQLDSEEQKRAYATGVALANYIESRMAQQKELRITLNKDILLAGLTDAFNHQSKMSEQDVHNTLLVLDEQIKVLMQDKKNKIVATNKAWLDAFAKQEGVKKTKQGLFYLVKNKGTGAALKDTDTVEVSYKGTLIDGTVVDGPKIDNSYEIFRVANMPPILRDSVKLIRNGGEVQVVIPPSAVQVSPDVAKPEALVIYTISIHSVNKQH
ncbi:MAG: FKBP-type peptidyl-prolyl cis-trans isomerase N-terminal domain-containing protein [Chania sp.]